MRCNACALLIGLLHFATLRAAAQTKAAGNPPVIDEQPIARTVSEGGHVTLSVLAHGTAPLSYQWRNGGFQLTNNSRVSGATSAVLNIDPVQTDDTGGYTVTITNSGGSITSSLAGIIVNPIGMQVSVVFGSGLNARVFNQVGEVCRIESANDVGGPWITNAYTTNYFSTPPLVFLPFAGLGGFLRARFDHMLPILYPAGVGTVRAYGKLNEAWRFDASGDLKNWISLATITNSTGWVTFGDPRDFFPQQQFYRIAPP